MSTNLQFVCLECRWSMPTGRIENLEYLCHAAPGPPQKVRALRLACREWELPDSVTIDAPKEPCSACEGAGDDSIHNPGGVPAPCSECEGSGWFTPTSVRGDGWACPACPPAPKAPKEKNHE